MKKYIFIGLLFIAPLMLMLPFAREGKAKKGIQFQEIGETGLKAALAEGAKTHKLVYLDFHSPYCGMCRRMDRKVYPNKALGTFFNENFINVRIDTNTGEGMDMAAKYGVGKIPTMLFLKPDGTPFKRLDGYRQALILLDEGKEIAAAYASERQPVVRK